MNYQQHLKNYEDIINLAQHIDNLAAKLIGKPYGTGEFDSMENHGCIFSFKYNSACHCHPEYVKEFYLIPAEWFNALEILYYSDKDYDYIDDKLISMIQSQQSTINAINQGMNNVD